MKHCACGGFLEANGRCNKRNCTAKLGAGRLAGPLAATLPTNPLSPHTSPAASEPTLPYRVFQDIVRTKHEPSPEKWEGNPATIRDNVETGSRWQVLRYNRGYVVQLENVGEHEVGDSCSRENRVLQKVEDGKLVWQQEDGNVITTDLSDATVAGDGEEWFTIRYEDTGVETHFQRLTQ